MDRFEKDYKELLHKYKNNEWTSLKEKQMWRLELEVMEELNEKFLKERIRQRLYEKYLNEQ